MFSYDSAILQDYLEAEDPDPDYTNPKTWPIITSEHLAHCLGEPYSGVHLLPPFVAYERELVDACTCFWFNADIPVERADGTITDVALHFHMFPFVFSPEGNARTTEYVGPSTYATWVNSIKGQERESPLMDPFEEVLDMIRERRLVSATLDTGSMRQELIEAQNEAAAQKLRADAAEKAHTDVSNNFEQALIFERRYTEEMIQESEIKRLDLKQTLADEKEGQALTTSRVAHALSDHDHMKAELEAQGGELDATKKEASTAKEQIRKIRDEMKRGRERKRGADGDAPGSQLKRIKIEE